MKPLPQATLKPQNKVVEKEKSHSGIFLMLLESGYFKKRTRCSFRDIWEW
jgi:hypothetical protein